MTRLAQLIATEEGFFKSGSLPARNHNPGDLRHSPHSVHPGDANAIGVIDTDADGWGDLERQLQLYAARRMSIEKAVYEWAPPTENNTEAYLAFVVNGFNGAIDRQTPLSEILQIMA